MGLGIIVVSGIVGTALMTGCINLVAYLTRKHLQVVYILGTLVTFETTKDKDVSFSKFAYLTGLILHYAIGIGFATLYALFWRPCFYSMKAWSPFSFGAAAGLVAIVVWRVTIALHPHPPQLPLKMYLILIGIGHVLFAVGTEGTFYLFDLLS